MTGCMPWIFQESPKSYYEINYNKKWKHDPFNSKNNNFSKTNGTRFSQPKYYIPS